MSLESKIEELTKAVEALTALLNKQPVQLELPLVSETTLTMAQQEPATVEVNTLINRSDLQTKCLDLVRKDRENKSKIKAILAVYNASVIADVPEDKLEELQAELGKL